VKCSSAYAACHSRKSTGVLATGADDEVGSHVRQRHALAERLLVDGLAFGGKAPRRPARCPSAAVVEADVETQGGSWRRSRLGLQQPGLHFSFNRERSPTNWNADALGLECGTSRESATAISSISPDTSSAGRRQFSEENANTVSTFTPRSPQWRTQARSASTPILWPATRGRQRRVAQARCRP